MKALHLSEGQWQREMWTRYSTLVLDDPSFPQVVVIQPAPVQTQSECQVLTPDETPSIVDNCPDYTAFAHPEDPLGLANITSDLSETSTFKQPSVSLSCIYRVLRLRCSPSSPSRIEGAWGERDVAASCEEEEEIWFLERRNIQGSVARSLTRPFALLHSSAGASCLLIERLASIPLVSCTQRQSSATVMANISERFWKRLIQLNGSDSNYSSRIMYYHTTVIDHI